MVRLLKPQGRMLASLYLCRRVDVSTEPHAEHRIRVKVFVDFWNFQLTINTLHRGFRVDWQKLGPVIARESLMIVDSTASLSYQGMNVYGSYDTSSQSDEKLRRWASNTLNRFPGVQVIMLPRQRKRRGPVCPSCHEEVSVCPNCRSDIRGTEEKGVDTRIATDMVSLAWVDNYDVATLLSSDHDFVPVVEFLSTRGIKTVHGAFRHMGAQVSQKCWGSIQIHEIMEQFRLA